MTPWKYKVGDIVRLTDKAYDGFPFVRITAMPIAPTNQPGSSDDTQLYEARNVWAVPGDASWCYWEEAFYPLDREDIAMLLTIP